MLLRPLRHIKNNAVGYIALFVALTGTSYAAFRLPAGSVGGRELKNQAITAAKLSPTSVAATVRAWATLVWTGAWRIQASNSDIHVVTTSQGEVVTWRHTRFPGNCIASVTPIRNVATAPGTHSVVGSVSTTFDPPSGFLAVAGFAPSGVSQPQSVSVLIFCPSPRSQQINR